MKKLFVLTIILLFTTLSVAKEIDIEKSRGIGQEVIVSLNPIPACNTVVKDVIIKAVFNVELDEKHIKRNNIKLKRISGKKKYIRGKVSYSSDKKTIIFTPKKPLKEGYYKLVFKGLKTLKNKGHNNNHHKKRKIRKIKYRFYVPTSSVDIVDTIAPVITLNGDSNITLIKGDIYDELGANAVDDRDGNVSVVISGEVDISTVGSYVITYSASDSGGNNAYKTRSVTVEELPKSLTSLLITPSSIALRVGNTFQVSLQGTYDDGSIQTIIESISYAIGDSTIASIDNFGLIEGLTIGTTNLRASVGEINSPIIDVIVVGDLNTTNFNFTNFGTNYIDTIPIDATVSGYDEKRFCMIAGQILSEEGSPLPSVKVSILNHPEYGSTLTDSNGSYVIPSEGGLQLTMRYQKNSYTTVDRNIQAPVQDWVRSDTVTMLEIDSKVTAIDLTRVTPEVHISTPVNDDRGERSTTLVFNGITRATVTAKDGTTRELTNLNVRATEFKTSDSMPSDLPSETAYTYCSDLTVDGVSDDENVTFDAPVIMYVDNFLGFDVGEIVPIGYYDRNDGKWKASKNGVVVKLLDVDNDGVIDAVDSTGDDAPNDLNGDGSFEDEVSGIVDNNQYGAGKTYWRAEITHFTPWDHNWPYGPPEDAVNPDEPNVKEDSDEPNDCTVDVSSYVTSKSRVFHEDIAIAGTNITLHYSSKNVDGYKHVIDASINASALPSSVIGAKVSMEVSGRIFSKNVTLGELNKLTFEWDGRDALGNIVSGEVKAKITTTYKYNLVYYRASSAFSQAWNRAGGSSLNVIGRNKIEYSSSKTIVLNVGNMTNNNSSIANGWTLSNIHTLGVNHIYKGNGTEVEKKVDLVDGLFAYYQFDGDTKDTSLFHNDGILTGILSYEDGIVGKAAYFNGTQSIKTPIELIGEETNQYLTIALWGKAENSSNSIFITNSNVGDQSNSVHLSASSIGLSGRFGGYWSNGFCYKYSTINILTIEEPIPNVCGNIEVVDSIYDYGAAPVDFTEWHHYTFTYDNHFERIYIDGIKVIEKELESNMVGGANQIPNYPRGDNIYNRFLNIGRYNNTFGYSESYFTSTMLKGAIDDLRIYKKVLTDEAIQNIYNYGKTGEVSSSIDSFEISDNSLEYQFNIEGRHLSTKAYPSHTTLETYSYDENGYVITIANQFNQTTTITRDTNGNPTQITAPNGQVTNLTVDENNNLIEVSYEDNSKYQFTYFDGSLMDKMTDPNENEVLHFFNENGRIVEEIDGENGSYQFVNLNGENDTTYKTIFPEGNEQSSKHTLLADGRTQIEMTLATGESVTTTFSADEQTVESNRDGVVSKTIYTVDSLTQQQILSSTETTQTSGLKSVLNYAITYDGNETDTNSKTSNISTNAKTTTLVEDYNAGTATVTTPMGRVAKREYDVNTLLISKVTAGTLTPTTYLYDNKGRTTSSTRGTRTISYSYSTRGNVATVTNSKGEVTSFTYDIMDRLVGVSNANGTTESYVYDNNGNMSKYTTPRPSIYDFAFNGVDKRTSLSSPLKKTTNYSYNKNKRLTQITRPSGKTIVNNYSNDRLLNTVTNEGTSNYTYLFANKLGSITKGSESVAFEYDGNLLTKTTQTGELNHISSFTYNNDFQVTSNTYAETTQNHTYDNDGLLITSGAYSLTRDAQNAYVTNVTDGTLSQSKTYNNYGEINKVEDNVFSYELSQRDNTGAITQKIESINGISNTYDYTFDNMGRLTQVKKDNTLTEEYSYDNNGNRASATVDGTNIVASYTLDDQLEVYGDNTYRYNDDGYLSEKTTPDGTTTYSYGTLGELKEVITPTQSITYQQNANNQRVAKLINGEVVEKYLWANLTTLLAIYDKDNNLVQRFEYAEQRMPISMTQNNEKYYLHYDQVGTLKAVSDSSLNIVKEISYDTYGNILLETNENLKIPFGFAGGLYDADTKLTRFGYRDYDSYTGKWTAKDPIGFAGGDANLYGYVLGDPINLTDSDGLQPKDKHYGHPRRFWDWYHKNRKDKGDPDLDKDGATDFREEWDALGQPSGDKKRRKRGEKREEIGCDGNISGSPIYPMLVPNPNPWRIKRPFSIWDLFLTPAY